MNAAIVSAIDTIFRAVEKQFGVSLDAHIEGGAPHLLVGFNAPETIGFTDKQFALVQECVVQCLFELGFYHALGGVSDPDTKWYRWVHENMILVSNAPVVNGLDGPELQQSVNTAINRYVGMRQQRLTEEYTRLGDEIAEREERRNEIVVMLGNL